MRNADLLLDILYEMNATKARLFAGYFIAVLNGTIEPEED